MTYAKPVNASLPTNQIAVGGFTDHASVLLPRRCLQLVAGPARWSYTHEIRREDVLDDRRVSITWRQTGGKKGVVLPNSGVSVVQDTVVVLENSGVAVL
jgi:hypothetical protein